MNWTCLCYGVYLRAVSGDQYLAETIPSEVSSIGRARLVCHRPGNHDESAGFAWSIRRHGTGHRTDELSPT